VHHERGQGRADNCFKAQGVVQGLQQGYSAVTVGVPIAYKKAETVVSKHFNAALKNNAQYVVKDQEAADKLLQQWFWTRMSRCRPTHPVLLEQRAKCFGTALRVPCCPEAHLWWRLMGCSPVRKGDVLLRAQDRAPTLMCRRVLPQDEAEEARAEALLGVREALVRAGTAGADTRCRRLPGALEHAAAEAKALPKNLEWGHIRRGEVTLGQVGFPLACSPR